VGTRAFADELKKIGLPAKQYNRKRFLEKAQMKKNIQMHNESIHKKKVDAPKDGAALPAYLLDREVVTRAKVLSNSLKQKRKEKAGKWNVPLPRCVICFLQLRFTIVPTE
jgi:ribosome biogenesis protein NSA2